MPALTTSAASTTDDAAWVTLDRLWVRLRYRVP
jgi:hypothetical protein